MGGFPHSTGGPARWADFHNFNYTFVLFVDCAAQWGAGRDGAVSPVTGRAAAANSQYGSRDPQAGRRTRAQARGAHCAPPWGTCGSYVTAGWVMA
ncbi:hypothetical protein QT339_29885 (plasmid) [Escherichia coli]|nr:hypothetical protein [Escherichia coli]